MDDSTIYYDDVRGDETIDELRATLRALYGAAKRGRWRAVHFTSTQVVYLNCRLRGASEWELARLGTIEEARVMAAARNAVPALFQEIDRLRAGRGIAIAGTIDSATGSVSPRSKTRGVPVMGGVT